MAIKVNVPGLATTVQDLGRPGYHHPGIPLWGERVTLRTLPPPWGMNALVAAAWVISRARRPATRSR